MIPDTPPKDGVFVVDTAELFAALEGRSGERRGLERMCRLLGMRELSFMHNAGNDAHVRRYPDLTIESMRRTCSTNLLIHSLFTTVDTRCSTVNGIG